MAKNKKTRSKADKTKRTSFPHDEKERSWLKLLLDAYFIVDKGIAKAIEAERKKGKKLACSKGCSTCCSTHNDIPIYPLEIIGITWFAAEKISGPERQILKKQLADFRKIPPCPFLIEGVCSVHPVRPMACRQFNVFGKPCKKGEDPFHTRREDVMDPVKKHVDQAFFLMLPYYGIEKESERIRIVEAGGFHKMVKELHACNWTELAAKMDRFDREV
jgi:Fe-S-cluster containining protein